MPDRAAHWEGVYGARADDRLSWHEDDPSVSLDLARAAGLTADTSVIDIGGGTSRLAAALRARGLRDVTVLDLSQAALERSRACLGAEGDGIAWIVADVTRWTPSRTWDLWHDRAAFHFLVEPADRAAYLDRLDRSLVPGGHAIIATFAPDGPETCSGLPVARYSPESLAAELGGSFSLVAHRRHAHVTPWGTPQNFQFSLFRKAPTPA